MSRQQTAWIAEAIADAYPLTHWSHVWHDGEPALFGQFRAACGAKVDEREITTQPTCPRCRTLYAQYERREPWGPE